MRNPCYRPGCPRGAVRYLHACHDDWLRLDCQTRAQKRALYDAIYGRRAYLWQLSKERVATRIQPRPVVPRG